MKLSKPIFYFLIFVCFTGYAVKAQRMYLKRDAKIDHLGIEVVLADSIPLEIKNKIKTTINQAIDSFNLHNKNFNIYLYDFLPGDVPGIRMSIDNFIIPKGGQKVAAIIVSTVGLVFIAGIAYLMGAPSSSGLWLSPACRMDNHTFISEHLNKRPNQKIRISFNISSGWFTNAEKDKQRLLRRFEKMFNYFLGNVANYADRYDYQFNKPKVEHDLPTTFKELHQ